MVASERRARRAIYEEAGEGLAGKGIRRWTNPVRLIVISLAIVIAFASGAAFALLLSSSPTASVDPALQLSGVITIVNEDGTSFCFTGDRDQAQHCSEAYLPPGSAPLEVGERVEVTVTMVRVGGLVQEIYIVTDRDSAPANDGQGA